MPTSIGGGILAAAFSKQGSIKKLMLLISYAD